MIRVGLEAPWQTWHKQFKALFERDPDISVGEIYEGDETDYAFDVEVKKHEKFIALDRLVSGVKTFGNVTLGIILFDQENECERDTEKLFKTLFNGNPIVKEIASRTDQAGVVWNYVCFEPSVIQFFDDNLADYNGNWNGLAQDIAYEVFADNANGIFFCTAPVDGVNKPLGEWP